MESARTITKEAFLAALAAGYEMPPEEAEFCVSDSQTDCEVLCQYPGRWGPPPDGYGYPDRATKVWELLAPYYAKKALLEKEAWRVLAEGLSDDEWCALWLTNYNRDSVAKTLRGLAPAAHPAEACSDPECTTCGARDCPHGEPLHYHHDECPACWKGGDQV